MRNSEWSLKEGQEDNVLECNQLDIHEEAITRPFRSWERCRSRVGVQVVCYVIHMVFIMQLHYCSDYVDRSTVNISRESDSVRRELMTQLSVNETCRDVIRMGPQAFARLCGLFRDTGHLKDNEILW